MIIKKAKKSDFESYIKLKDKEVKDYSRIIGEKVKFKQKNLLKKDYEKFINSRENVILFAVIDKKIVGYLHGEFYSLPKKGYISDVFVFKEYRKQGIATGLIDEFAKILRNKKYKKLKLDVNIKNKNGIKLYKKRGFKLTSFGMTKKI